MIHLHKNPTEGGLKYQFLVNYYWYWYITITVIEQTPMIKTHKQLKY